jgi:hypothetical protein
MLQPSLVPRPRLVTIALAAAWLEWALAIAITLTTTARIVQLGVALPTLATQALLILGASWGSNVARSSYFVWTIFGVILTATGGDIGSNESQLSEVAGYLSSVLMAVALIGLLLPPANRWYLAQRTQNKVATAGAKLLRAKRNLKMAMAWALVLPLSLLIAIPLKTPLLAVCVSCAVAMCVGLAQIGRQSLRLYKLRASRGLNPAN